MRQVIYRPDRFIVHRGESEIHVDRVLPSDDYTIFAKDVHGRSRIFLDPDQALRLAAYILSTHPQAAGSEDFEGIAFAPATASCEELPAPDFVVVPPVHGAEHADPLKYRAEVNQSLIAAFSRMAEAVSGNPGHHQKSTLTTTDQEN